MTAGGGHARLLLAVHHEFIQHGLILDQVDQGPASRYFEQSDAGAFPALHYSDVTGGRAIVVRALAMFDDLIVNAAATPGAEKRRININVSKWAEVHQNVVETTPRVTEAAKLGAGGAMSKAEGEAEREGRESNTYSAAAATKNTASAFCAPPPPLSPLREAFRSRVLSGLLLHLCPPRGHFADLFGCGEELRQRVLGFLSARDLATFGLASRSAAVSGVANCLWEPLVRADFSKHGRREGSTVELPLCPSPDRGYHPRGGGGGNSSGDKNDGGGEREGVWRRTYAELERVRRETEAERQAARKPEAANSTRLMAWMCHLGRARYPFPGNPYLPRGPYHTPGPAFPEYDWGSGIGGDPDDLRPPWPSSVWGAGGWRPPHGWRSAFGGRAGGVGPAAGSGGGRAAWWF